MSLVNPLEFVFQELVTVSYSYSYRSSNIVKVEAFFLTEKILWLGWMQIIVVVAGVT